jgi:hypothetical protein
VLLGSAGAAHAQAEPPQLPSPAESDDEAGWGEDADAVGWGEEEEDWGGNDAVGFAEPSAPAAAVGEAAAVPQEPSSWTLSGFLRTRQALWVERFDDNPLAQARQSADFEGRYGTQLDDLELRLLGQIHFEYDAAYLVERDSYDDATLDAYEWQIIGGETFAALSTGPLEITLGRQIVAWGKGEMLSPLDVVNPRDMREPGLAELVDIRMAVLASRVGLFVDAHRFELMVVHEAFFGLQPAPLSDFSPFRAQLARDPTVGTLLAGRSLEIEHAPDRFDPEASQLFGRWTWAGHGIDLALYGARVLDRQGVAGLPTAGDLTSDPIPLRLRHPHYSMVGHAGALPEGDFVLRWELGADIHRPLMTTDTTAPVFNIDSIRRNQLNWMAGVTYAGISDGQLGVEYAQAYVLHGPGDDDAEVLLVPVDAPAFALRYSHNFLRETLQLLVAATAFGLEDFRGFFVRAELNYELQDALKIGLGYATFQPHGEDFGPLTGFDEHDRLFATLRWDFALH